MVIYALLLVDQLIRPRLASYDHPPAHGHLWSCHVLRYLSKWSQSTTCGHAVVLWFLTVWPAPPVGLLYIFFVVQFCDWCALCCPRLFYSFCLPYCCSCLFVIINILSPTFQCIIFWSYLPSPFYCCVVLLLCDIRLAFSIVLRWEFFNMMMMVILSHNVRSHSFSKCSELMR